MYKLDYASPIGVIEIAGTEHFIASVLFAEREEIVNFPTNDTPQLLLDCSTESMNILKADAKIFRYFINCKEQCFKQRYGKH